MQYSNPFAKLSFSIIICSDSRVGKCQSEGFDLQNVIQTDKKFSISAVYFIVLTDKISKTTSNDMSKRF